MSRRLNLSRPFVLKRDIERRLRTRYAIEQPLRYRVLHEHEGASGGSGKTLNLSSCGVLFTTENRLQPGQSVELLVNWPARPGERYTITLMLVGTIVRVRENGAALAIQRYEFQAGDCGSEGASQVAASGSFY